MVHRLHDSRESPFDLVLLWSQHFLWHFTDSNHFQHMDIASLHGYTRGHDLSLSISKLLGDAQLFELFEMSSYCHVTMRCRVMVLITKVISDILLWKRTYTKLPCTMQHSHVRPMTITLQTRMKPHPARTRTTWKSSWKLSQGKRQTLCCLSSRTWQSDPPKRIACSQVGRVRWRQDSHCSQLGFL